MVRVFWLSGAMQGFFYSLSIQESGLVTLVRCYAGNIPLQGRRFNQGLERCLTGSKRKEIDCRIGNTRLPRGDAVQPRPAVTHPDGASWHALGHMGPRLEDAALV